MAQQPVRTPRRSERTRALLFATVGFMVTFWAWSLISPLGPHFVAEGLTADSSLLVAVPVLVGSLGRIVVGALTDRLGGRFMMSFIAIITVIPVLFVGFIGQYTYPALIVGGFFLGVAGTSFAVGVPYVNRWFTKESRGSAIGVYGIGMGGTAIAAFTTVPLHDVWPKLPFVIAAAVLIIYAVLAAWLMRNPRLEPVRQRWPRLAATMKVKLTWQAAYLYMSFGTSRSPSICRRCSITSTASTRPMPRCGWPVSSSSPSPPGRWAVCSPTASVQCGRSSSPSPSCSSARWHCR